MARRRSARLALAVLGSWACGGGDGGTGPTDDPGPGACGPWPPPATSPYVLPYAVGSEYPVTQGNCSGGHRAEAPAARHAYDFGMLMGTEIVASRGGTVLRAVDSNPDGTGRAEDINWIWIRHPDGSVTEYAHIMRGGALVAESASVVQGQPIALSGNSGPSTGPHLHWVTLRQVGDPTSLPITFLNTAPHPRGLVAGTRYMAQPYGGGG